MAIEGILFDKDGTLLDYEATWMPVNWLAARAAAGGDEALAASLMVAGGYDPGTRAVRPGTVLAAGNAIEIADAWEGHLPGRGGAPLVAMIDDVFEQESATSAVQVTDLKVLFGRLKARNLALGVATSDSLRGIAATLAGFEVLELLDFKAGYDSGHGVKPGPGMVQAFCAALGLVPAAVAVVGDSFHDLEMGRRAGAGLRIGVLSGASGHADLAPHADHVIDSIADLEALLDRTTGSS